MCVHTQISTTQKSKILQKKLNCGNYKTECYTQNMIQLIFTTILYNI